MDTYKINGLSDDICNGMTELGFLSPTEIQKQAAVHILRKHNTYISSATGSGKTFAYLAPIMSLIKEQDGLSAIIVTPTVELAVQIEKEAIKLAKASKIDIKIISALGTVSLKRQQEKLDIKPNIIIGSVGRLRDLAINRNISLHKLNWIILDEADRLFENEVKSFTSELLDMVPIDCSKVLVSATLPKRTVDRSAKWFTKAQNVSLDSSLVLKKNISHWCFHSTGRAKIEFLRRFDAAVKPNRCLIFTSTNASIFNIEKKLEYMKFPFAVLKTESDGKDRHNALTQFSEGRVRYLLTTDLGARGLDIKDISHVISFDLPEEPTVYIHRAGRTGRAGKKGISIIIADLFELKRASKLTQKYGFAFTCKILDHKEVHDIMPEDFFELANKAESKTN